jgi:NAD(P)-dependent dehydrogenase (short-subunit alcohol dehydrogenase family)
MDHSLGIITGAAGGIGRATAERFAAEGWSLLVTDIDSKVHDVASSLRMGAGRSVVGVVADITTPAGVSQVAAKVGSVGVPLRFLGLIAGTLQKVGPVATLPMDEWDRVMNINVRSYVLMMQQFIPSLRAAGKGSIVTISSWYGRSGHGFFSAYCASKAAVISLTQTAAAELAPDIRVNSVAPGNVATRMHFTALEEEAVKRGITTDEMRDIEWAKIPLERAGDPSEMASAVYFLASEQGSYLTGATLDVNGGCGFF